MTEACENSSEAFFDMYKQHYKWVEIEARHFVSTGVGCGLNKSICEAMLEEMANKTQTVIEKVSAELPQGFPFAVADKIFAGLTKRAGLVKMRNIAS